MPSSALGAKRTAQEIDGDFLSSINQRLGASEILGVFNTVSGGSQHTVGRYIRTIAGLRVIISVDRVTVVVISLSLIHI